MVADDSGDEIFKVLSVNQAKLSSSFYLSDLKDKWIKQSSQTHVDGCTMYVKIYDNKITKEGGGNRGIKQQSFCILLKQSLYQSKFKLRGQLQFP